MVGSDYSPPDNLTISHRRSAGYEARVLIRARFCGWGGWRLGGWLSALATVLRRYYWAPRRGTSTPLKHSNGTCQHQRYGCVLRLSIERSQQAAHTVCPGQLLLL